ncbi:MAG: hypothetical protein KF894_23500 [Labilithrix sp.]|nr:hypothetical protein [Labilithrix sp.]
MIPRTAARLRRPSRPTTLLCAVAILAATSTARADDSPAFRRARAQELFESALADVEAGRFDVACPKFAASNEADPKTSTLLNLGSCYESLGRTASAWAAFREAEGVARKIGREDLEATARTSAESLAPKLVRLTIVVPAASRAAGLVISRESGALTSAEWGVGIPVDPGEYALRAAAPGRVAWTATVTVKDENRSVEVPVLALAPAPPAPPPPPSWWTPMRTTGVALAGAGAASIVTGVVLGFVSKSSYDGASAACSGDECSAANVRTAADARSLANAATAVIAVGAAVTAVGGALIVLAPPPRKERAPGVRASLHVGPTSIGAFGQW